MELAVCDTKKLGDPTAGLHCCLCWSTLLFVTQTSVVSQQFFFSFSQALCWFQGIHFVLFLRELGNALFIITTAPLLAK